ncbi:MAG: hypothetical protein KC431_25190, partial [Myxococcales bacterium]|nr:hypothetical protein [Myxococcales bacterium]
MSKAAELIEGLTEDAEFDSDGGFSLDREKARQKMRQFQLSDPHRYVLLLVEVAAQLGATRIDFEIDSDDMIMRFDGRALSWEDLDELYTSLFVKHGTPGIVARRQLALACNAVMALNPRFVRIQSLGSTGGVQAVLEPERPDVIERLEQGTTGTGLGPGETWTTRIHVKERFRPGLLVRFLADLGGTIAEEQLLRERCRHASLPITLDGERVSRGLPKHLVAGVAFSNDTLRGVAGYEPDIDRAKPSAVVLLSNGVEISTHDLTGSEPGLWFWVDASNFRKDVSQNDVVRNDPAYEAMLPAIGGARDAVLGSLARMWKAGTFTDLTRPSSDQVFLLLRRCFLRWADHEWLRSDAGELAVLADLPYWRRLEGGWISPRAFVEEQDPERGMMLSRAGYDGVLPLGWGPVLFAREGLEELKAMHRIHPGTRDVTDQLAIEVPRERARRQWRSRPHEPRLPRGAWRLPHDFGEGLEIDAPPDIEDSGEEKIR